jgi:hypothetical protein
MRRGAGRIADHPLSRIEELLTARAARFSCHVPSREIGSSNLHIPSDATAPDMKTSKRPANQQLDLFIASMIAPFH